LDLNESGKAEEPVNLLAVVDSVVEDANFEANSSGKSVVITARSGCWVKGDANLLRSCLENVVRNALHYTAPHTAVEIVLSAGEERSSTVSLTVSDRGPGVPSEALAR